MLCEAGIILLASVTIFGEIPVVKITGVLGVKRLHNNFSNIMEYTENNLHLLLFQISFNRNRTTFATIIRII